MSSGLKGQLYVVGGPDRGQTDTLHYTACEESYGVSAARRQEGQSELFLLVQQAASSVGSSLPSAEML